VGRTPGYRIPGAAQINEPHQRASMSPTWKTAGNTARRQWFYSGPRIRSEFLPSSACSKPAIYQHSFTVHFLVSHPPFHCLLLSSFVFISVFCLLLPSSRSIRYICSCPHCDNVGWTVGSQCHPRMRNTRQFMLNSFWEFSGIIDLNRSLVIVKFSIA
jgi:hypothetical protein